MLRSIGKQSGGILWVINSLKNAIIPNLQHNAFILRYESLFDYFIVNVKKKCWNSERKQTSR